MPAVRTHEMPQNAEASSSKTKFHSSQKRKHKHGKQRAVQEKEANAAPGVQKIKAALRQTRRLLAKDKLAADVRVETERRLRALEAELQQAELAKKERAYAVRYHKVKFFERQKVTRKIKQALKRLETEESKLRKKISAELHELRVDLNYILHYPKTKKYISLLPPEVRKGDDAPITSAAETEKTNAEREEVRKWVREQMKGGKLPAEPEVEIGSLQHGEKKARSQTWPTGKEGAATIGNSQPQKAVEEDDFFGEDDGEESS